MRINTIQTDIIIFGGGIAGLWALNRLKQLGYNVLLLENHTLGGGQTIKSQGIIHGGLKYTLRGFLTPSANSIEAMPHRWEACLQGNGEIDLCTVNRLSHHQLLFSTGKLVSDITNFFAQKTLRSRVKQLKRKEYPEILQKSEFKGTVYQLDEMILDIYSLIETLVKPHYSSLIKVESKENIKIQFNQNNPKEIDYIELVNNNQTFHLKAKRYVFAAGEGNQALCDKLNNAPKMQLRPLHMVIVKLKTFFPLYAHCIDYGMTPRLTITSHTTQKGEPIWYLGGQLAEEGVTRTKEQQLEIAKKELHALFPWLELREATWASFFVNRAEPEQPGGKRPNSFDIQSIQNAFIAWPTKLALTPLLIDSLIDLLKQQGIIPSENLNTIPEFEKPAIALPVWDDILFNQ